MSINKCTKFSESRSHELEVGGRDLGTLYGHTAQRYSCHTAVLFLTVYSVGMFVRSDSDDVFFRCK